MINGLELIHKIRYVQIAQSDFSAGRELFAGVPGGTAGKSDKDCRKI